MANANPSEMIPEFHCSDSDSSVTQSQKLLSSVTELTDSVNGHWSDSN